ncbi:MAG TPA: iron-containing alcohol dehydrogenase [Sedimenticola thiotaurini]|uniref:Iron-containing alcohol dehydrogenase n=1 Tax=Sedimenticola thiotaurini TaxID=1543721 RepID=A0A831W2C5_9GAMM|nr:iron-containing alcohol dehydrogenase [Sedimenticola thiotaurini]
MTLTANWNYPTSIRVGAGRVAELPDACRELGIGTPLLVTDPGLAGLPLMRRVLETLQRTGLQTELFSAIKANPNGDNVAAGVAAFHRAGCDGVIACGGGSALDAAKAVALMVGQQRPLWDFEDLGDNWTRVNEEGMAPVVALPTTAGTGSEVGRASVITDQDDRRKKIIFHPRMLPERVILDPELTLGLPPDLTAATGMDALSHSLEAFCAPSYHPMAEGIAVEGIRLVQQFLPRAVADGSDLEARTQMLVASAMGATAFQRGLGGMHALAHPLGALYDAHHGTLNAILMPYVLQANRDAIGERIDHLAQCMDLPGSGYDAFLEWVLALRELLSIPHTLAEIGIDDSHADRIGAMAAADPSAGGNPVDLGSDGYRSLFLRAVAGEV